MLELRNKELRISGEIEKDVKIIVCYDRIVNDRNGNPRYSLSFFYNDFNLNYMLHDDYKHKINKNGYLIAQSYSIDLTIDSILNDIKDYFEKYYNKDI